MSNTVTLKDIALQLQVSASTVSRALSGDARVTEETRAKVKQVAQELGYRPNAIARSLRIKKTGMILLVVRDIKNPFYLDIMAGIESSAREAGYNVLMCNCDNDNSLVQKYVEMLLDHHADGMILMTGKLTQSAELNRQLEHLPVVIALEAVENCALPNVLIDNVAAGEQAVNHLIALGHKRIAHVRGPIGEIMSDRRLKGYQMAMQRANLTIKEGYIECGNFELWSAKAACQRLMQLPEPPTAIFFSNDEMAVGAIKTLRELGYSVPQDVSIVGFDNLFWCQVSEPALTTIHQPRFEIGQQSFQLLNNKLNQIESIETNVILPTEICIRESTAIANNKDSNQ